MTGLILPGQGFQALGLLAPFAKAYPKVIQQVVDQVDAALPDLRLSKALLSEDYPEDISQTSLAQPLILAASYGIYKTIEPKLDVKYAMGHSLGEYTAWTVAGILDFEAALKLVRERGLAMQQATQGLDTGMTVIVKPRKAGPEFWDEVDAVRTKHGLDIANVNAESQRALSGATQDLEAAVEDLKKSHARLIARKLNVSGAFHSKYMQPAQARLAELAAGVNWAFPGTVNVISNLTARPFENVDEVKKSCTETLVNPVYWHQSAAFMAPRVESIVSLGPGRIGKMTQNEYDAPTVFVETPEETNLL